MAPDFACDCRNPRPGGVIYERGGAELYASSSAGSPASYDYSGESVTGAALSRLVAGRYSPFLPDHMRLRPKANDRILLAFAGHSGEGFMKFQDFKELPAENLGAALRRIPESIQTLWLADTCKAASLHKEFDRDGLVALSSSNATENSYGHGSDPSIGVILADRFSFHAVKWIKRNIERGTLDGLRKGMEFKSLGSTATLHGAGDVLVKDFFRDHLHVRLVSSLNVSYEWSGESSKEWHKTEDFLRLQEIYMRHVESRPHAEESQVWFLEHRFVRVLILVFFWLSIRSSLS